MAVTLAPSLAARADIHDPSARRGYLERMDDEKRELLIELAVTAAVVVTLYLLQRNSFEEGYREGYRDGRIGQLTYDLTVTASQAERPCGCEDEPEEGTTDGRTE